ncbi:MAG: hypothetical protein R6U40_00310 [Desulfobacterales bacterium]
MDDFKLWDDLATDAERVDFLRSGRAWKTGIIAESVVEDVADAFEFRMKAQQKDSPDKKEAGKHYPDYFNGQIPWDSDSGK